jgi:hypothetical protein
MTLGINTLASTGDSEFTPLIMYMAREGRFYRRDRVGGANGFENDDQEVPVGSKIAVDFGSINVGWLRFASGMAPSFAIAPLGQPMPEQPDRDHRQGFRLLVHLGKNGGLREFATTAKTVLGAVDELHTAFEAAPEAATGKIPVVEFTGATRIVTENRHGTQTNFRPNFKIVSWIDRVAEFGERTVPPPGGHAVAAGGNGAARPAAAAPQRPSVQQRAAQLPQGPVGVDDDLNDDIPF